MPKEYRINKYIAECIGCSRRNAEKYVNDGLVKVNGVKVVDIATKVKISDKVILQGKPLKLPKYTYIIFNKPSGFITTRYDEKGRKTIYDLLPEKMHHLKPVGRLDKDSSGLLLLTNDGELINRLTHPKFQIPKKYKVVIKGNFSINDAKIFSEGLDIGDDQIASAEVLSITRLQPAKTELLLELHQGYNRQIRRMVEKLGYEVTTLKRLTIGPLTLKKLKRSEFSSLTDKEIDRLREYIDNTLL